jgi:hypothetical protein
MIKRRMVQQERGTMGPRLTGSAEPAGPARFYRHGRRAAMLLLAGCSWVHAQEVHGLTARQAATDAAANEVKLVEYGGSYLRYQVHTQDAKGDQIREVIESKDGTVARVVKRGDRPLTPEEDAEEQARLQEMLNSPDAFRKHVQKDLSGKKLAVDLIRLLPDAMIFSYAPGQPQRGDKPTGEPDELVIDFKPDPRWNPPTMISQALQGLEGRCWIDANTHHLTRLEADLFQGVNFGFGVFAHIYPGGKFELEQVPVGDGRWVVDHFTEHVTVRAMMVKTIRENTQLVAGEFAAVPAMGYQEAIKELMAK